MRKVLYAVLGISVFILLFSAFSISQDTVGDQLQEAMEALANQPSTSTAQTSINVCAGINIGSCNGKQSAVATTTETRTVKSKHEVPPLPLVITVILAIVVATVGASFFLFDTDKY